MDADLLLALHTMVADSLAPIMSKLLFETRVSVSVCQPASHKCFVASSSGDHDD